MPYHSETADVIFRHDYGTQIFTWYHSSLQFGQHYAFSVGMPSPTGSRSISGNSGNNDNVVSATTTTIAEDISDKIVDMMLHFSRTYKSMPSSSIIHIGRTSNLVQYEWQKKTSGSLEGYCETKSVSITNLLLLNSCLDYLLQSIETHSTTLIILDRMEFLFENNTDEALVSKVLAILKSLQEVKNALIISISATEDAHVKDLSFSINATFSNWKRRNVNNIYI